ncbi:Imm26 family immunity protein [Metabacillus indicus]|uniref:Imm26 family immunity protein n=1 Tax=Metabacillus indicus TaxID=246786 RepID=UPI0004933159|nr:Imm26 family immunity protein [Metabacillus indicus]KEZ48578.1 hypothetical protein AZ46_0216835 [Metabacillus indicus LMG 22858]
MKPKKRRVKVGNVHAIPLPNNKYAFGKVYKDGCIGIYKQIGNSIDDVPKDEEFNFIVGVYQDILKSGKWPLVAFKEFPSEDAAWPPKMCVIDTISNTYSIYFKGEFYPATHEECKNLELAAAWDEEHIIDRILGSNRWNNG